MQARALRPRAAGGAAGPAPPGAPPGAPGRAPVKSAACSSWRRHSGRRCLTAASQGVSPAAFSMNALALLAISCATTSGRPAATASCSAVPPRLQRPSALMSAPCCSSCGGQGVSAGRAAGRAARAGWAGGGGKRAHQVDYLAGAGRRRLVQHQAAVALRKLAQQRALAGREALQDRLRWREAEAVAALGC